MNKNAPHGRAPNHGFPSEPLRDPLGLAQKRVKAAPGSLCPTTGQPRPRTPTPIIPSPHLPPLTDRHRRRRAATKMAPSRFPQRERRSAHAPQRREGGKDARLRKEGGPPFPPPYWPELLWAGLALPGPPPSRDFRRLAYKKVKPGSFTKKRGLT